MKKFKKYFQKFFLITTFLATLFLRVYKLPQTTMFLSDQGRDAIIIYNIVTLKHLPAIGAPTSIGQVYLGPFYYYLISPFLLLFNFNPVGLSFGVAFLSSFFIVLSFFIIKKIFGWLNAFIFIFLTGFSVINIQQSRFSWNPNLLPFFSFFSLYFFYQMIKEKKIRWAILFGSFFSFSTQLHYLAFFLIIPVFFYFFYQLWEVFRKKNQVWPLSKNYLISFVSFIFFSSPLLIFDLRHNFLNSKNFIKLFTQGSLVNQTPKIFFLITLFIIFLLFFYLKKKKTNDFLILHSFNILLYLWGFKLLNTPTHIHYFGSIYLSLFFISSFLIYQIYKSIPKKIAFIFLTIILITYFFLNFKNYNFLWQKGENQIEHSKKTAQFLAEKINNQPYNIATWPVEFAEDNYLYFLILKGLKPANRQKIEITDQMFVLCQKQPCQVINSPSWNISMFGKAKIDKIWKFEGLYIYKLIHEK